ncbi:hypothetical protein D3C80_1303410 [compost metagenome]
MGACTGARATRQVHLLPLRLIVQPCRQLPRIALGIRQPFATTGRAGAGHHRAQGLTGVDQETQRLQLLDDERGILVTDIGQQQALPRRQAQAGVTQGCAELGRPLEHRRVEPPQRWHGSDVHQAFLTLWKTADGLTGTANRGLPLSDVEQGYAPGQRLQQRRARMFGQQMAHSGLVRSREFQKQLQHGHHQAMSIAQQYRADGCVDRTPGKTEDQQCLAVALNRAQPQVMWMLEHRQAFTAIEQHSELGR